MVIERGPGNTENPRRNRAVRRKMNGESDPDPSYTSYSCSNDVVWRIRPESKDDSGDLIVARRKHYSMRSRRDKALDIFRNPKLLEGAPADKEEDDTDIDNDDDGDDDDNKTDQPNNNNNNDDKNDTNDVSKDTKTPQLPLFPKQTRVGFIDDERVEFELVSNETQPPEKCCSERMKISYSSLNFQPMSLEEKIRLCMCQWTIVTLCCAYVAFFIAMSAVFAGLLMLPEGGCCGDPNLTFSDNFQFAIQTWTTIGYGTLSPVGYASSFWVFSISVFSLIGSTIFAGLLFLRIVRPSANLQFSKVVTYCNVHGLPCLELRVGNPESFNELIDVAATLTVLWEGLEDCEFNNDPESKSTVTITKNLRLLQDSYFTLPGVRTFRHVIDESSPLFGLRLDEFDRMFYLQFRVVATNKTTLSSISKSTFYDQGDVLIGHRFQQQIHIDRSTATMMIDFAKMNETYPYCAWYPKKRKKVL